MDWKDLKIKDLKHIPLSTEAFQDLIDGIFRQLSDAGGIKITGKHYILLLDRVPDGELGTQFDEAPDEILLGIVGDEKEKLCVSVWAHTEREAYDKVHSIIPLLSLDDLLGIYDIEDLAEILVDEEVK